MRVQGDGNNPADNQRQEDDVSAYMRLLDSPNHATRVEALRALGRIGPAAQRSISRLQEILFDEHTPGLRGPTCDSLIAVGADPCEILSRLLRDLKSPEQVSRSTAAGLLLMFVDRTEATLDEANMEAVLPDLLRIVRDNTNPLRMRCDLLLLLGLWQVRPDLVIPVLTELLESEESEEEESLESSAMQAVANYGQAALAFAPRILRCLQNKPNGYFWEDAEEFLGAAGTSEEYADLTVSTLIEGLRSEIETIRELSALTLRNLGEHAIPAIPALCKGLEDEYDQVRWAAAESLGELGAYALRAVPFLIKALHHFDPALQDEADRALRRIAPDKHATILLDRSCVDHAPVPLPVNTVALYLGNGRCQVGAEPPIKIEDVEATVLEALIELGAANKQALIDRSGVKDAPRVLRRICTKYPLLATHIVLPGRKGRGGYSTTISQV